MTPPAASGLTDPTPIRLRHEQQDLEALERVLHWAGRAERLIGDPIVTREPVAERPPPRLAPPRLRIVGP